MAIKLGANYSKKLGLPQYSGHIHREQRSSTREFSSVRSTLRSIQGLKL